MALDCHLEAHAVPSFLLHLATLPRSFEPIFLLNFKLATEYVKVSGGVVRDVHCPETYWFAHSTASLPQGRHYMFKNVPFHATLLSSSPNPVHLPLLSNLFQITSDFCKSLKRD